MCGLGKMFYQNEPLDLGLVDDSRHQDHYGNEMESLKNICRLSLIENKKILDMKEKPWKQVEFISRKELPRTETAQMVILMINILCVVTSDLRRNTQVFRQLEYPSVVIYFC